MIVVIPAYEPDEKLIRLVGELRRETPYSILIVNDGSAPDKKAIFDALSEQATVLNHKVNRGKGAALKTAFEYIRDFMPCEDGIVTVDADGQHLVSDINKVCADFYAYPEALILGSRRFTGSVPFKSRAGNAITRVVFAISTGVRLYDTQTGLRAFSVSRIPDMLALKGDRYEYEINMLLDATKKRVSIREVWIETVYINDNETSHFHPLRDAWRIYKMILLFAASSAAAFLIDYALVLLLSAATRGMSGSLLISVVGARIGSSFANYLINRKLVFGAGDKRSIFRYYLLAAAILIANYAFMALSTKTLGIGLPVAKILVEVLLYPLSFYVQRKYVFSGKNE